MTDSNNNVILVYSNARLHACAYHVSRLNHTTFNSPKDAKEHILSTVRNNMDNVLSRYSSEMVTIQTAGYVLIFYGVNKNTNTCQVEFMIDPYIADLDNFHVSEHECNDDTVKIEHSHVSLDTE